MKIQSYRPEIRFADIDALGHVNNAIYLSYFEQSRIHFFSQLIGKNWDWNSFGLIVAKNELSYHKPIVLNDEILIDVTCSHVGSKSFTLNYTVKRNNEICTTGSSVMVCFDYRTGSSMQIPETWREKLVLIIEAGAA